MLQQYEPVETVGSPEVVSATGLAVEPPQPFAAVSSLTAIHLNDHARSSSNTGAVAMHVHAAAADTAAVKKSRLQRKRKLMRTRFNDLTRSRNWRHCQKILFLLGVVGVAMLASFVVLRVVSTDEFNHVIEWIQVRACIGVAIAHSVLLTHTGAAIDAQTHETIGSLIYVLTFTTFIILWYVLAAVSRYARSLRSHDRLPLV